MVLKWGLARVAGECGTEIGERVTVLALVLVNLTPCIEGIRVLRSEAERFVDFRQAAFVIALLVVVVAEYVADASVLGIEPKPFVEIRQCAIEVALSDVGGGAAGIGAGVFRTEPKRLGEVGDGTLPVALEAWLGRDRRRAVSPTRSIASRPRSFRHRTTSCRSPCRRPAPARQTCREGGRRPKRTPAACGAWSLARE